MFFFIIGRRQTRIILVALACLAVVLIYGAASTWVNARGGDNPDLVWYVPTEEPVIALTFDDGPDAGNTSKVLDILAEHGAKGTFFFIGQNVRRYPEVARRAVAEGHEVGNHTYSHRLNLRNLSEAEIVKQLQDASAVITEACGVQPRVFRPPGGAYNPHLISVARGLGYRIILWTWTTNPSDAYGPGVDRIVQRATQSALPGDIILLHEGVNNGQTLRALPKILDILEGRGFRFVTVSQLLALRKAPLPTGP